MLRRLLMVIVAFGQALPIPVACIWLAAQTTTFWPVWCSYLLVVVLIGASAVGCAHLLQWLDQQQGSSPRQPDAWQRSLRDQRTDRTTMAEWCMVLATFGTGICLIAWWIGWAPSPLLGMP